jgi:xylulokinase
MVGLDRSEALERAAAAPPGAGGLLLLPYFAGERTPNLPTATGQLTGLTDRTATPDLMVRAALDGVAAGLDYCREALARLGVSKPKVTLVGGGAAHPAWRQAIADATELPVMVRAGGEHAARGAAMQAAAIVLGQRVADVATRWRPPILAEADPRPGMREAFESEERRRLLDLGPIP